MDVRTERDFVNFLVNIIDQPSAIGTRFYKFKPTGSVADVKTFTECLLTPFS